MHYLLPTAAFSAMAGNSTLKVNNFNPRVAPSAEIRHADVLLNLASGRQPVDGQRFGIMRLRRGGFQLAESSR
ncbi:hypothetical protein PM082_004844 [Marasmius tenuissimus]|nr:hypothetical protein PM082_004844 [Marasmius tenuissimus]